MGEANSTHLERFRNERIVLLILQLLNEARSRQQFPALNAERNRVVAGIRNHSRQRFEILIEHIDRVVLPGEVSVHVIGAFSRRYPDYFLHFLCPIGQIRVHFRDKCRHIMPCVH